MSFSLKKINYNQVFLFLVALLIIQFILLYDLPFFWDAMSKSQRANWIFDHNLTQFIVPTEINSGHPPLWISLLAVTWTLLGKTIWASRLVLLLVNIGVVYQILQFCKHHFMGSTSILFALLVVLEPTFIAQTTSLNNDMLLLFFTLFSINSLLKAKPIFLGVALMGLLFTNLRGIYLFVAIAIIHFIFNRKALLPQVKGYLYSYLVPIVFFGAFCIMQYSTLGWFIITQNKGFNTHRQAAEANQMAINLVVFAKCFFEYGRILLYLMLAPLILRYYKTETKNKSIDVLLIILTVYTGVLFIGTVPFSNPFSDRYFMICFLISIVLLVNLWKHFQIKSSKFLLTLLVLGFLSGHFWIYPSTTSQAWDGSLAYLNYYKVERSMEDHIETLQISHQDIGTRIGLNDRTLATLGKINPQNQYADFDLNTNRYILLSNIENKTKDKELNTVRNHWKLIKCYSQLGVYLALYENEIE